jgi:hypothetical protein
MPRAATSVQIKNRTSLLLNRAKFRCRSSGARSECRHTHDRRCLLAFGPDINRHRGAFRLIDQNKIMSLTAALFNQISFQIVTIEFCSTKY